MSNTEGVLYLVTGEEFVDEARTSARSVREHMPDVEIAIATDDPSLDLAMFDHVIELDAARQRTLGDRTWLIDSTLSPDLSPFDKTLYLDSDTYVCADVSELFDLLGDYDLAVARQPEQQRVPGLPKPWHLYNCGVIAYRDTEPTRTLLSDWRDRYHAHFEEFDEPVDQPAFAEALYNSEDLCWFTLPREYNVRFPRRGVLAHDAKIVHGRHRAGLETVAKQLNSVGRLRTFRERSHWSARRPATVKNRGTPYYHIERSLSEDGLRTTLKKMVAWGSDRYLGTELYDRWFRVGKGRGVDSA